VIALGWIQSLAMAGLFICLSRLAFGARAADWDFDDQLLGLVAIGLVVVAAATAAAAPYLAARDQASDEAAERGRVVAHVFKLGAAQRSRERAGVIVSTATDGVERAAAYRGSFLGPMIASMTAPVLVLALMAALLDPVVATWTAIALPVIPLTLGGFQAAFRGVSRRYRENGRIFAAKFLDAIQGLPTLRLLNADQAHGRTLAKAAEELRRHVMRLLAGNQLMLFVVDSLFSLAFIVAVAGLALWRVASFAIEPYRPSRWCSAARSCWSRWTGLASSSTSGWAGSLRSKRSRPSWRRSRPCQTPLTRAPRCPMPSAHPPANIQALPSPPPD
jgi:ABC-type transport system involved in cytochrome bd biosynthesis fused ATPase/permease subunit